MSGKVQLADSMHVTNRMSYQLMQFGSRATENEKKTKHTQHLSLVSL